MPDVITIYNTLARTPLPNILVITGIIFLFLAIVGQFAWQIRIGRIQQILAGILGTFFLVFGMALYVTPELQSRTSLAVDSSGPTSTSTSTATNTPTLRTDTPTPPPTLAIAMSVWESLRNGNFEEEISDNSWEIDGTMSLIQPGQHGQFALRSFQNASSDDNILWAGVRQHLEVDPGESYYFYAWLKGAFATNPVMSVRWYDENDVELGKDWAWGLTESDDELSLIWKRKGGRVTAPRKAHSVQIEILHGVSYLGPKNDSNSILDIDNVTFVPTE